MAEGFGSSFGPLFLAAQQQQYARAAQLADQAQRQAQLEEGQRQFDASNALAQDQFGQRQTEFGVDSAQKQQQIDQQKTAMDDAAMDHFLTVAPHLATADRVALAGALKSWRNTGQWLPEQHGLTEDVSAPTVANPQTTLQNGPADLSGSIQSAGPTADPQTAPQQAAPDLTPEAPQNLPTPTEAENQVGMALGNPASLAALGATMGLQALGQSVAQPNLLPATLPQQTPRQSGTLLDRMLAILPDANTGESYLGGAPYPMPAGMSIHGAYDIPDKAASDYYKAAAYTMRNEAYRQNANTRAMAQQAQLQQLRQALGHDGWEEQLQANTTAATNQHRRFAALMTQKGYDLSQKSSIRQLKQDWSQLAPGDRSLIQGQQGRYGDMANGLATQLGHLDDYEGRVTDALAAAQAAADFNGTPPDPALSASNPPAYRAQLQAYRLGAQQAAQAQGIIPTLTDELKTIGDRRKEMQAMKIQFNTATNALANVTKPNGQTNVPATKALLRSQQKAAASATKTTPPGVVEKETPLKPE